MLADASGRQVGYGLNEGVAMGPVISADSKTRIEGLVDQGVSEGANLLIDGRGQEVDGFRDGYFVHPTVLADVDPTSDIAGTEIFGPVLSLMHAETIDDAIAIVNDRPSATKPACSPAPVRPPGPSGIRSGPATSAST